MVRDVTPVVRGFPGLPLWLDGPYVKKMAAEWGVSYEEARKRIRQEES